MSLDGGWIVNLAEVAPDDRRRVGAKAWRLGRMQQAGFPVSPGFCLGAEACRAWSPAVQADLLAAYRALGSGPVAVRSSALEEDGEGASYAGVYCSELPIDGEAALLAAVGRCLASWHARTARDYRIRVGNDAEHSLAILVQRLVPAVAAGVAYTCDPLRPRHRQIHIDAIWGLAEPLASGRVSADSFVLSRRGRLIRQNIAAKSSELSAAGLVSVATDRVHAPCLTPAAMRQVVDLALRAEALFGGAQDVEFALAADGLWLVQARPIVPPPPPAVTPLERYLARERRRLARKFAALRRRGVLRGREVILSNGNVGELLPTPTPMSFGLFQHIFSGAGGAIVAGRRRLGYRFDAAATAYLYEQVAGQVYFNLEIDAATFDFGASPPIDHYLDRVSADPGCANYPEVNLYRQHYTADQAAACFGAAAAGDVVRTAEEFRRAMVGAAETFLQNYADPIDADRAVGRPWREASVLACAQAVAKCIRRMRAGLCVQFVIAARLGFFFAARVRDRLLGTFGDAGEELCAPLLTGLPGSRVTQQALDLEQVLAGSMRRGAFLAAYGHTADNELELSEPRLHEAPGKLDAMLRDLAASGRSPAAEFAHQRSQRVAAEAALRVRLAAAAIDPAEQAELLRDLHLAQRLLPLRETIKHHYTAVYADIRSGVLHLADLLQWDRSLIFHLQPRELARTARDPASWLRVAEARRDERGLAREAARRRLFPNVIFAAQLAAIGQLPDAATNGGLRGTGLSPGCAWGVARVIDSENACAHGEFSGNEILVLRSANLGLANLFRLVAGVVVEVGGLLAHSACQAREAGIPALLLAGATSLIPDGCRLMINGTAGTVCLHAPDDLHDQDEFKNDIELAAV